MRILGSITPQKPILSDSVYFRWSLNDDSVFERVVCEYQNTIFFSVQTNDVTRATPNYLPAGKTLVQNIEDEVSTEAALFSLLES